VSPAASPVQLDAPPADPVGLGATPPDRRLPAATGPRWPARLVLAATWLAVGLGVVLRVRQWWHARSFWLDELMLIKAISEQRFGQLLEPLHYAQAAPPGWLLAEHVLIGAGPGERGARLLPLLLGVGTVVLTALLARTLLGGPAALAATVLVAASTPLVNYSAEVKQYSGDGFWLQLVLLLGCRLALGRGRPDRERYVLAGVAAVAVWCSHPTALALAGIFVALGLQALVRRRWRELAVLAGCAVPFAAGLAIEYATLLSAITGNEDLRTFWAGVLPPPGRLTPATGWDWFAARARDLAANPLYVSHGRVLLVLVLAGLVTLGLRRPLALPVLLLAVGAIVAAGLIGAYPIANRLALWVIPLVAVVAAAPLDLPYLAARLPSRLGAPDRVRARVPVRGPAVAVAVLLALAATAQLARIASPWVADDAGLLAAPPDREEARPVLAELARQRRPGDLVLVDWAGSRFAADHYGPLVGLGPYRLVRSDPLAAGCERVPFGAGLWTGTPYQRVWLVTTHADLATIRAYAVQLDAFGPVRAAITRTGAHAYRFDRAARPRPGPVRQCLSVVPPGTPLQ
jgi:Dolichyl-phosphate-mannose-protein mannosyltransferase